MAFLSRLLKPVAVSVPADVLAPPKEPIGGVDSVDSVDSPDSVSAVDSSDPQDLALDGHSANCAAHLTAAALRPIVSHAAITHFDTESHEDGCECGSRRREIISDDDDDDDQVDAIGFVRHIDIDTATTQNRLDRPPLRFRFPSSPSETTAAATSTASPSITAVVTTATATTTTTPASPCSRSCSRPVCRSCFEPLSSLSSTSSSATLSPPPISPPSLDPPFEPLHSQPKQQQQQQQKHSPSLSFLIRSHSRPHLSLSPRSTPSGRASPHTVSLSQSQSRLRSSSHPHPPNPQARASWWRLRHLSRASTFSLSTPASPTFPPSASTAATTATTTKHPRRRPIDRTSLESASTETGAETKDSTVTTIQTQPEMPHALGILTSRVGGSSTPSLSPVSERERAPPPQSRSQSAARLRSRSRQHRPGTAVDSGSAGAVASPLIRTRRSSQSNGSQPQVGHSHNPSLLETVLSKCRRIINRDRDVDSARRRAGNGGPVEVREQHTSQLPPRSRTGRGPPLDPVVTDLVSPFADPADGDIDAAAGLNWASSATATNSPAPTTPHTAVSTGSKFPTCINTASITTADVHADDTFSRSVLAGLPTSLGSSNPVSPANGETTTTTTMPVVVGDRRRHRRASGATRSNAHSRAVSHTDVTIPSASDVFPIPPPDQHSGSTPFPALVGGGTTTAVSKQRTFLPRRRDRTPSHPNRPAGSLFSHGFETLDSSPSAGVVTPATALPSQPQPHPQQSQQQQVQPLQSTPSTGPTPALPTPTYSLPLTKKLRRKARSCLPPGVRDAPLTDDQLVAVLVKLDRWERTRGWGRGLEDLHGRGWEGI